MIKKVKTQSKAKRGLRYAFIISALLCFFLPLISQAEEKKPQTYNFTITVKYNSINLKDIADKEAKVREVFHDAQKVQVDFEANCPSCNSSYYYLDNGMTLTPN